MLSVCILHNVKGKEHHQCAKKMGKSEEPLCSRPNIFIWLHHCVEQFLITKVETSERDKSPPAKLFASNLADCIRTKYKLGSLSHTHNDWMTDVSRYGGGECLRKTLLVTEHLQWSTHIAQFTYLHLKILWNCSLCEFLLTVGEESVVPVAHLLHVEDWESRSSRGHWGGKEHRHRNRTVDLNFIYNLHLSVLQWHLIIVHNLHYPPCRVIRRLSK